MSIFDRAKIAYSVLRDGVPKRWQPAETKKSPFTWTAWQNNRPQWQMVDMQNYVTEGFNQNSIIYSAIMYKAKQIASVPLRAYRGDIDQPEVLPIGHPLSKLVSRPNTYQSWSEFQMLCMVYLDLAGEMFGYLDRPNRNSLPNSILPLRPDRVYMIPRDGKLFGWLYVPEGKSIDAGIPILLEDMMMVKYPNPSDPFEGMGRGLPPLSSGARSADVDNKITEYLKIFFNNGAMPQGLLKFDTPLDDAQVTRARERWMEIYGGYDNWSDVAVVDSGGTYQRIGNNFNEMGFEAIDERNESRILGPFGVPPILIGTRTGLARSTYSNYESSRKAFWEDTMIPLLQMFEVELQYYLQSDDGGFIAYDTSGVPALQPNKVELTQAAYQAWQMGAPANLVFPFYGLHFDAIPGGDTGYLPMNLMPVGEESEPETSAPVNMVEAEDDAERKAAVHKWTTDEKTAMGKMVDNTAQQWEARYASKATEALEADRRALQARLSDAKKKSLERKATPDWDEINMTFNEYMGDPADENWRSKFRPVIKATIADTAERWTTVLGVAFDVRNIIAEAWYDDYLLKFAQPINKTTMDGVSTMLKQGMNEGWSIDTTSKRLDQMFTQWMSGGQIAEDWDWYAERMPLYRRENIARTETIRASNAGSTQIFRAYGAEEHEWLATNDDRTRPSHLAANGQVRKLNEPFDVGGVAMMFPGDPSLGAGPEDFCNCRCTTIPVIPDRFAASPQAVETVVDTPSAMEVVEQAVIHTADVDNVKSATGYSEYVMKRQAEANGLNYDDRIAEIHSEVDRLLQGDISINRGANGGLNAVESGRFMTQYETGTSGGLFDVEFRAELENIGLGIPTDIDVAKRPVYGYVKLPDNVGTHHEFQYGPVEFKLKPSVKQRTTYAMGDSAEGFALGDQVGVPISSGSRIEAYGELGGEIIVSGMENISYIETQIQGGVTMDDVAEIIFHKQAQLSGTQLLPQYKAIEDAAIKRGIKVGRM